MPQFGYANGQELRDRNERRKRGLGEPTRMAKLEDEAARAYHAIGGDADWVNFETTISTSSDQIAMAPGYLQKTWEQDGRRYFNYKMDRPMLHLSFAFLSPLECEEGHVSGFADRNLLRRKASLQC